MVKITVFFCLYYFSTKSTISYSRKSDCSRRSCTKRRGFCKYDAKKCVKREKVSKENPQWNASSVLLTFDKNDVACLLGETKSTTTLVKEL